MSTIFYDMSDYKLLRRARAGSRLREAQSEAYFQNDLTAFLEHTGKIKLLLDETKRKNHVSIPQRVITRDLAVSEQSKKVASQPETESEPQQQRSGILSWLW